MSWNLVDTDVELRITYRHAFGAKRARKVMRSHLRELREDFGEVLFRVYSLPWRSGYGLVCSAKFTVTGRANRAGLYRFLKDYEDRAPWWCWVSVRMDARERVVGRSS